jgi:hypothetical protein
MPPEDIQIISAVFAGLVISEGSGKTSTDAYPFKPANQIDGLIFYHTMPLPETFSMEINRILLFSKYGRLLQTAAIEGGLKHFKEQFGPEDFGVDFHPGPAFIALGQIFVVGGNPR